MQYEESTEIIDKVAHKDQIEKIYYFEEIDKVIMFEAKMKEVRLYDAAKMKAEQSIMCSAVINTIEFLPDRKVVSISLCDKTIRFYEIQNDSHRFLRTLHVPSTQKCLSYVFRKGKALLFSGGTQGAVYAWNINLFFSNDYTLQPDDPGY